MFSLLSLRIIKRCLFVLCCCAVFSVGAAFAFELPNPLKGTPIPQGLRHLIQDIQTALMTATHNKPEILS
jgi:hypothetical protein